MDAAREKNYYAHMSEQSSTTSYLRKIHAGESYLERVAIGSTKYIGSPTSIVIHTIFFGSVFGLQKFGISFDQTMLILTTAVSLEAIYLSLFIQMTVNRQARQIDAVSDDVDEIQEDVEEISKDIDEIQEDVDSIQENSEEISDDLEGIHEHIEDIKENVEDLSEEFDKEDVESDPYGARVQRIEHALIELLKEVKALQIK